MIETRAMLKSTGAFIMGEMVYLPRAQRHVRLSGRAFAHSRFSAFMSNLVFFPRNFLISSSHLLISAFPWACSNGTNSSTLHLVQRRVKWISSK